MYCWLGAFTYLYTTSLRQGAACRKKSSKSVKIPSFILNFIRKIGMNRLAAVLDSRVLLLGPSGLVFSRRAEFKCFGGSSSGQGPPATGAWGAI